MLVKWLEVHRRMLDKHIFSGMAGKHKNAERSDA